MQRRECVRLSFIDDAAYDDIVSFSTHGGKGHDHAPSKPRCGVPLSFYGVFVDRCQPTLFKWRNGGERQVSFVHKAGKETRIVVVQQTGASPDEESCRLIRRVHVNELASVCLLDGPWPIAGRTDGIEPVGRFISCKCDEA